MRLPLFVTAALLSSALALPGLARDATANAWILKCQVDGAEARTFRIAPQTLQEWQPVDKRFGPNLCQTFACKADPARLEASVGSASFLLTLRVDRATGEGSWSTVGATDQKQTSGACSVEQEKAPG